MANESPVAVLFDKNGNDFESITVGSDHYLGVASLQDVHDSAGNSSTVQLAPGASFTGTSDSTLGVAGIQVCVYSDQPVSVSVQQSMDNANWDIVDTCEIAPGVGDGRTTQAVGSHFRVYVENLGPIATLQLRVATFLCPVVEAMPRSLTPRGLLRLSKQTSSFVPAPQNFSSFGDTPALSQDVRGQLATRSTVLTDELSFRSDFTSALAVNLTGTCYFRNGKNHIVGDGTNFLAEVRIGQLIKLGVHADAVYVAVTDVYSNTNLVVASGYSGATANGVGVVSDWELITGAGGSLSQAGSEIAIASGVTNGSITGISHVGDYLPCTIGVRAKIDQRIVNQEAHIGAMDGIGGTEEKQACVFFDGVDNTKVTFRTSFASADVENTVVTLPNAAVTSNYNDYVIEVTGSGATLWINKMQLANHVHHVPGPYDPMDIHAHIINTAVPASSTTVTIDAIWFYNFDRIDVGLSPFAEPMPVAETRGTLSACTSVAAAVLDTLLLAANPERVGATIFNDSSSLCYVKFGPGASDTSFTVRLGEYAYYEVPFKYVGQINAYWASAAGDARVTEIT
jgi:hypothetical protein